MKKVVILCIVSFALQLLLALFPYIPGLNAWFPSGDLKSRDVLDTMICILGTSAAITSASIGLLFAFQSYENSNFQAAILSSIPAKTTIEPQRDDEFYRRFIEAARNASHTVCISYFAPYPPNKTHDDDRKKYYTEILELIKKKKGIRFRRIVRDAKEMEPWIATHMSEISGQANADLAMIRDSSNEDSPLALSVQIIDDKKTWFVAVSSHERKAEFRDLYLENDTVGKTMREYHERLWEKATVLVDSGRFTPEGTKYMARVSKGGSA